jgi:hypothetical protein
MDAYDEGYNSRMDGGRYSNPYPVSSKEWYAWADGYADADQDLNLQAFEDMSS